MDKLLNTADVNEVKQAIKDNTFGNCAGIDKNVIDFVNFDDDQKLVVKHMVDDMSICFDDAIQKVRDNNYYLLKDSTEINEHIEETLDDCLVDKHGCENLNDCHIDKDLIHFAFEMRTDYIVSGDYDNGPLIIAIK